MSSEKPPEKKSKEQPKKSKEEMERKCDKCGGTGKYTLPKAPQALTCPKCKGKGWTFK
ncbi:MAG: hypothetical protein WBV73_12725 [Phormidium sp.]